MTQVLSEPAVSAVEAASLEAASLEEASLEEAAPPQAARDKAIMAAIPKASNFFIVFSSSLYNICGPRPHPMQGRKQKEQ